MGCDIHIIIQVFDPITGEYKFVHESTNTSQKIQISEHITFVIYSGESTGKLVIISSDELKTKLINHADCKIEECECQYDFNLEFHIQRDYHLFEKIANIRSDNELKENIEPKGLPEDASDILTHIFFENQNDLPLCVCLNPDDLHSHSYLSDFEIDNLNIDNSGGLLELKQLLTRVRENFPGLESRFIIAFDN
jgi:hypothetical protein